MNLEIEILESDEQIIKAILNELAKELNRTFRKLPSKFKTITANLLKKYIIAQPEWAAIISGDLRYELGIVDPESRLLNILDALAREILVEFKPFIAVGNSLNGGITIQAVVDNYENIINMDDAIVVTEKRDLLYWLQWMLLDGSSVIIQNYEVEFGPYGRTGGAHMILGGTWNVPSQYAGTANDNFITRAIAQLQEELEKEIKNCIISNLP
jgi:hypothetical protein